MDDSKTLDSSRATGPWRLGESQTFYGKPFWTLWKHHPKAYGGQQFLLNNQRTEPKRFYVKEKAEAFLARLNREEEAAVPSVGDDRSADNSAEHICSASEHSEVIAENLREAFGEKN